jgi:poly(3-hydroxyalkanoate) depolymerase
MPKAKRKPVITMEFIDGMELRTAYWQAEKKSANLPLLFFNGIGANLELTFKLGDMFPDRDIITFDIPGVGGSPVTQFPYRPWMVARWTRKLLDKYDMESVDVMGVSWGGAMAQQYAVQYRNRVGKLILCATTAGMTMVPGKPAALSKMMDARRYTDPNYMMENFATLYGEAAEEGAGQHVENLMAPQPMGYVYQLTAFLGWSSLPFIRFLTMPPLIMMGDNDSIVPLVNGKILNFALPNSQLHVVEGGGHLFIVTRAEESARVIKGFLTHGLAAEAMA